MTALMLAAHGGYLGVLENLLQSGVDVNHQHEVSIANKCFRCCLL